MGGQNKSYIVVQNDEEYNISNFLRNHPGGYNYIQSYKGAKIKQRMVETQHSPSALYLLQEYKTGDRANCEQDIENLIDWNRAILSQVGELGSRYHEWISAPVDRKVRLFENPILESLTSTPWYIVPIYWIPVIIYFTHSGINQLTDSNMTLLFSGAYIMMAIFMFIIGIILWSLIEYTLHRWLFHLEPSGSSTIFIYIHFIMHGLHHKAPFDSQRLVFPPLPASLIAFFGRFIYLTIFPSNVSELIFTGSLTGYLMYDVIHFYLHYGSPREKSYLYTLKRYHNQHHFTYPHSGFGISSVYWDKIFGTYIILRKLTVGIKW